ncbi:uncharacterized protein LOC113290432 [Papaver somniferum]|uniref:uncharacterized protein LOC113290432 n=1 Tax=Papaver somniferum TaxID=3469 RepID=UPI000E6FCB52|nr:uncharacterized protein LOC113290432 [Papaver somniferum]
MYILFRFVRLKSLVGCLRYSATLVFKRWRRSGGQPTLVIPEYILDPIFHTAYLIKSLKSEEYLEHNNIYYDLIRSLKSEEYLRDNTYGDFDCNEAFRIKKSPAEALGIEEALDILIETCKKDEGRYRFGCVKFLPVVVELVRFLTSSKPSTHYPLYLSLKLLRNLCGGEILNQNCLLEVDGLAVIARAVDTVKSKKNYGLEVVKTVLEFLGHFCRAGEEHINAVWFRFFPGRFKNTAKTRERDFLNVLCMVVHTCCDGSYEIMGQLHGIEGVQLVAEMLGTSRFAGGIIEDWLVELLDTICLKGSCLVPLFKELKRQFDASIDNAVKKLGDLKDDDIKHAHTYLLHLLTNRLNEKRSEPNVSKEFAIFVLRLFKTAGADYFAKVKSGLIYNPLDISLKNNYTSALQLVQHSIYIVHRLYKNDLKVIPSPGTSSSTAENSVFELLLSSGLVDHLLYYLCQFGPPLVKRFTSSEQLEEFSFEALRMSTIVLIGICVEGRKHVQDEIRQKGFILLLLQQCDKDQPLLRLNGLKTVMNLIDGNIENQQEMIKLMRGGGVPPLTGPGRLTIEKETGRARLRDC